MKFNKGCQAGTANEFDTTDECKAACVSAIDPQEKDYVDEDIDDQGNSYALNQSDEGEVLYTYGNSIWSDNNNKVTRDKDLDDQVNSKGPNQSDEGENCHDDQKDKVNDGHPHPYHNKVAFLLEM